MRVKKDIVYLTIGIASIRTEKVTIYAVND
jgi:hypothetical protein